MPPEPAVPTAAVPGQPPDLVAEPSSGRRFRTTRRVRLGDADRHGRLRLDALARLLQDVGNDDVADVGLDPGQPWVARRTVVWSPAWPRLGERLAVTTFCAGLGSRWAERRSSLVGDGGGRIEVGSVWVHIDEAGRPARLSPSFLAAYAEAAGERRVTARLSHPPPAPSAPSRPWVIRATDVDVLGHVNNAATWAAVEDEVARRGIVPRRAELEYHAAIDPADEVALATDDGDEGLRVWLTVADEVRASGLVLPAP